MDKRLLLYDADCNLCTRFKKAVKFLDVHGVFEFVPIDQGEEMGLLNAVPEIRRHRSFHVILPDGSVRSGVDALPGVFESFPMGIKAVRLISGTPVGIGLLGFFYSVASRLHDGGSCNLAPSPADLRVCKIA